MLDPWIIDEIRRREERRGHRAFVLELPIAPPEDEENDAKKQEKEGDRGFTIVDYTI